MTDPWNRQDGDAAPPPPPPIIAAPPVVSWQSPPRPRPPEPKSVNWPLIAVGSAAALAAALVAGWMARSIFDPPRERAPAVAHSSPAGNATPAASPSSPPPKPGRQGVTETAITHEPLTPVEPRLETDPPALEPPAAFTSPAPAPVPDPPVESQPSVSLPAGTIPTTPPIAATEINQKAQTLYQEIDVRRTPKFAILGVVTVQDLHYQMLSELRASAPDDEGIRTVEQTVTDTRLLKADELSRGMFEESLRNLKGRRFTYTLSPRGQVIKFAAAGAGGGRAVAVEPMGGLGFMVTTVMDDDGWKEMAELTFFTPGDPKNASPSANDEKWTRQMTHDFQPLGSWYGETRFVRKGEAKGLVQFDYTHHMTYTPPGKGAAGLPFAILDATFKPEAAGGTFFYDPQTQRVQKVQERFFVRGAVATELLGQAATVEIEEDQAITVRILDQYPWEQ